MRLKDRVGATGRRTRSRSRPCPSGGRQQQSPRQVDPADGHRYWCGAHPELAAERPDQVRRVDVQLGRRLVGVIRWRSARGSGRGARRRRRRRATASPAVGPARRCREPLGDQREPALGLQLLPRLDQHIVQLVDALAQHGSTNTGGSTAGPMSSAGTCGGPGRRRACATCAVAARPLCGTWGGSSVTAGRARRARGGPGRSGPRRRRRSATSTRRARASGRRAGHARVEDLDDAGDRRAPRPDPLSSPTPRSYKTAGRERG